MTSATLRERAIGFGASPSQVYVLHNGTRWQLLGLALRLATGRLRAGQDIDLITAATLEVQTGKPRPRVAFDGEKTRMRAPLTFRIQPDALSIIVPDPADRVEA